MLFLQLIRRLSSGSVPRLRIRDLLDSSVERSTTVYGWIRSIRKHKKVTFVDINDGSCADNLQVVFSSEKLPSVDLFYGSSVEIQGKLIPRPNQKPSLEVLGDSMEILATCDPTLYPFSSEWNIPYNHMRQYPHLRPRQREIAAMLRIRNKVEMLTHEYFQNLGFTHIHTPAITASDCEGAGELFSLTTSYDKDESKDGHDTFFGTPAHLTVSGQLHLEACTMGIGNVYSLNPAFRAEKSRPQTHLSAFHMLEIEVAFTKSIDDVTSILEDSIKYIISNALQACQKDLSVFYGDDEENRFDIVKKSVAKPFLKIEYSQVIEILQANSHLLKSGTVQWGDDLNDEHEKFITTYHENSPVLVHHFPTSIKPFYVLSNEDERICESFDLLFPNCGEMAGGTLREHRYEVLCNRLKSLELEKQYEWYAQLRQFGGLPHGGYGLGFDRLVKFILGINSIKDAVPFPRGPKSCML